MLASRPNSIIKGSRIHAHAIHKQSKDNIWLIFPPAKSEVIAWSPPPTERPDNKYILHANDIRIIIFALKFLLNIDIRTTNSSTSMTCIYKTRNEVSIALNLTPPTSSKKGYDTMYLYSCTHNIIKISFCTKASVFALFCTSNMWKQSTQCNLIFQESKSGTWQAHSGSGNEAPIAQS